MKGQTESINFERDMIYFIFYISCFITFFPDVSVRSSHQRCTIEIGLLKFYRTPLDDCFYSVTLFFIRTSKF